MKKSKELKTEPTLPLVDPILPLLYGTGIPYLRDGEGKDILEESDHVRTVEMSYRSFWVAWEQVEALAKRNYPRLVDGPMNNGALAALEAAQAFRTAFWRKDIPMMSEAEARRLRENPSKTKRKQGSVTTTGVTAETTSSECAHEGFVKKTKSKKTGEKLWKCENCGLKWPRKSSPEASEKPSKALKGKKAPVPAPPKKSKKQKTSEKPLKKKSKTKK